jgi:SAM-dependent methyltransferase
MDNFLQWKDWWSEKYKDQIGVGVRYASFKVALNLFHQRGGTNIVETGTIRALDDAAGGGNSTLILGDYAQTYDKKFWTVDILPQAIELSKGVCQGFDKNTQFVLNDSISFLLMFPEKIDFLYLDSMDCPEFDAPDSPNLIASQKHQLNELESAWDKLTDKSVVLLDDNNFENGGKCKLSIKFLQEKGWIQLWCDKQSLWING